MSRSHKGRYSPRNPGKYRGDHTMIEYRSSWERMFMKWCDLREEVLKWSSEEMCIWYMDPITKKNRRYFPDFIIQVKDSDGLIRTEMIEVKPYKQMVGPDRNPARKTKAWIYEVKTYATNMAKWEAANAYAKQNKLRFRVVSEEQLFHNGKRK